MLSQHHLSVTGKYKTIFEHFNVKTVTLTLLHVTVILVKEFSFCPLNNYKVEKMSENSVKSLSWLSKVKQVIYVEHQKEKKKVNQKVKTSQNAGWKDKDGCNLGLPTIPSGIIWYAFECILNNKLKKQKQKVVSWFNLSVFFGFIIIESLYFFQHQRR